MRFVFVHGAFVRDGAWWWSPVAARLGEHSDTVALPSCGEGGSVPDAEGPGFADDVAAVRAVLDEGGPAIVVGHSYGGAVMTEAAADHPNAAQLVYVSAFLPEPGDTHAGLSAGGDDPVPIEPTGTGALRVVAGEGFDQRFLQDVADAELVRGAHERLTAQSPSVFGTPLTKAAWQQRPTTYLVCAQDNSTAPKLQREHARRAGRVVELPTGHHPFLSRPDLFTDALKQL